MKFVIKNLKFATKKNVSKKKFFFVVKTSKKKLNTVERKQNADTCAIIGAKISLKNTKEFFARSDENKEQKILQISCKFGVM